MDSGITSQVATADFLQLLTIQLQNQDPIDPVKQEQFTAQLAQFSQLEEIESLNASFAEILKVQQFNQGISLVGKEAQFTSDDGGTDSGVVERLVTDRGSMDLIINGDRVALDLVSGVIA